MAAIAAGKLAGAASRHSGRGGGTAIAGLISARIDPHVVRSVSAQLGHGSVVVTGTNGKTTTTAMLAAIARVAGLQALHNRSGSNLMRGLAATAVAATNDWGELPQAGRSLGVFEVDEATLPQAVPELRPKVVVFTNLFRDQLDRYGEVDSVSGLWQRALATLDPSATIVLNADDPSVAGLAAWWKGPTSFYGVDDPSQAGEAEHAADSRWCAACGTEYTYRALYFGHLGVWKCPGCGRSRPEPDVRASAIASDSKERTTFEAETPAGRLGVELAVAGLYNVYNGLAAAAGALALGLPLDAVRSGLSGFGAAFGRQERLAVQGRDVRLLLCKNPAGTNQVLRLLRADAETKHLLLLLNDGAADGRDISWIWDVDYELLAGSPYQVVVSGRRAADLALRLKYAGLGERLTVEEDSRRAVARALAMTPVGERLSVLPTYTAMLDVREQLARMAGRSRFWER